jgi:hypothetical protein
MPIAGCVWTAKLFTDASLEPPRCHIVAIGLVTM